MLGGTGPRSLRCDQDAEGGIAAADISRQNGAQYPRSPFGQALMQIGQLIKSDLGLEIAFTELGGWDNHVNRGRPRPASWRHGLTISAAASRRW